MNDGRSSGTRSRWVRVPPGRCHTHPFYSRPPVLVSSYRSRKKTHESRLVFRLIGDISSARAPFGANRRNISRDFFREITTGTRWKSSAMTLHIGWEIARPDERYPAERGDSGAAYRAASNRFERNAASESSDRNAAARYAHKFPRLSCATRFNARARARICRINVIPVTEFHQRRKGLRSAILLRSVRHTCLGFTFTRAKMFSRDALPGYYSSRLFVSAVQ